MNGRTSANTAGRDITKDEWDAYDAAARVEMRRRIARVSSGPLHDYGLASSLMGLLQSTSLGSKGKQTLEQVDHAAYQILAMRRALVEERTTTLLQHREVRRAHQESEETAIRQALGSRTRRAQAYRDHLLSESFLRSVRYKGFSEGKKELARCIFKLNALDPAIAHETTKGWLAAEIDYNPVRFLDGLPADDVEKSIRALLESLSKPPEAERVRRGLQPSLIHKAPSPPITTLHNLLAEPKQREAIARALLTQLRAPQIRNNLSTHSADAIFRQLRMYRTDGAAFCDGLTKTARGGRIANVFFSCWALFALARSGTFELSHDKKMWEQIGLRSQAALGLPGSIPDAAKFCAEEIRPLLSQALVAEIKTIPGGTSACKATRAMAFGPRIAAFCGVAGAIGGVVALYYAAKGVGAEQESGDGVGMACKITECIAQVGLITAGLSMALGATCAPLLVGALALSAAASLADKLFGETEAHSEVRNKLEALGLFEVGDRARKDFKRRASSRDAVRRSAVVLPLKQRLEMVISCMKGKTKSHEEAIVWKMFCDSRSEPQSFIWLIEATDPARIADELENNQEALDVLSWTLEAYARRGLVPGRGFTEQLIEHCKQHRWQVILQLFGEINDSVKMGRAYDKIPPAALSRACMALMEGNTNSAEESSVSSLLNFASEKQLKAMFTDFSFELRVRDELSDEQFRRIKRRAG